MKTYTILLENLTVGTVTLGDEVEEIIEGQEVTVTLGDENGHALSQKGVCKDVLESREDGD